METLTDSEFSKMCFKYESELGGSPAVETSDVALIPSPQTPSTAALPSSPETPQEGDDNSGSDAPLMGFKSYVTVWGLTATH